MSETINIRTNALGITLLQALLIAQACLQLLDLASTYIAIQAGGYEANPVSRALIEGPGWFAYGAVKVALALAFIGLWPVARELDGIEGRITAISMGLFCMVMAGVVVNNAIIAL